MAYRVKTSWILRDLLFKRLVWRMPPGNSNADIYLTFDDGPHPTATRFVLDQLKQYNAKATFFCIGKNVAAHEDIYSELLEQGHSIGNHTQNHLNGWHTRKDKYLCNIRQAEVHIDSRMFRPPYGRITRGQINSLLMRNDPYTIYMWDVLSGDFDTELTPQQCLDNVLQNIQPGSIVVFHDSDKAWERMSYTLPKVLAYCREMNWNLKALPNNR
ncbi:MAG: polysaccharide deacetylase family protein [Chitinophagales bacterium]|nr:polysaccharide deacetylase family protein [Chitinophagales bacterium]